MNKAIILHLEDDDNDAELIARELDTSGLNVRVLRAKDKDSFARALEENKPDAVLLDFSTPGLDGHAALAMARRRHPLAPCLIVSGELDEAAAAALLRAGAADYVMKDRRARLALALRAALERRSAAALHAAFKRSNDMMFFCGPDARILDVNDAFCRHYGYAREEVLGKSPSLLRSRHSTDALYKRMWSSILDPNKGYWRGEMINKAKDGREIPLILTITAVRDDSGEVVGYVSNAVDITEQVAMRTRVAHSEALAGLGEMAAVVAHEIRNPLGSIVMAAKQLAAGGVSEEENQTILRVLRSESQRLNEVLSNFLSFARPRPLELERVSLNAIAEEVAHLVQSNPDLSSGVTFTLALDTELKAFPLDAQQLRQVLWNIVLNAIQAMDGKGAVSVATGHAGQEAWVSVADDGPGIPADSLPLIFKPFHTTKRQGTGLGLAIADRIVKAHGGRMKAENLKPRGARLTLYLPSIEE